ncbi:MAG: HNH endonuclease [Myxococcales bacterium]|nr:HNH endonuclease [Myxococcales bacterium]
MKKCFREPIPNIFDAARYLDAAVSAHASKRPDVAELLLRLADAPEIRAWTESIWGPESRYAIGRRDSSRVKSEKTEARMPTTAQKAALHERDGFHCRFCGIPVIRAEVRIALGKLYPTAIQWGKTNIAQHAAFQCMWAQYDHVVPHSSGGSNELENLVVTCGPCNFGKKNFTLDELGLLDPRHTPPVPSRWDGLERVLRRE